jgi:hypothetical protein
MKQFKNKHIILSLFTLFGFAYFSAISNLDISSFWRGEFTLIPLQIMAVIYITYLRWDT